MFYVYVIQNEKDELYYGYSSDLRARIKSHNEGENKSTKNHKWRLVYYEAYLSSSDAREREKQLKKHGMSKAQLNKRIKKSLGKD